MVSLLSNTCNLPETSFQSYLMQTMCRMSSLQDFTRLSSAYPRMQGDNTNHVFLCSLVVHLLGKHPRYTLLPAEDRSWTVSAATQAMYRLESMKPLLIKQHATKKVEIQGSTVPADASGQLAARLAALKAGSAHERNSSTAAAAVSSTGAVGEGSSTAPIHSETTPNMSSLPDSRSAGGSHPPAAGAALVPEDADSVTADGADIVAPPLPPSQCSTISSHCGVDVSIVETSSAAAAKAAPAPLRCVSHASELRQFAPMVGIRNPGSMCYISSSVAVLLRCGTLQNDSNRGSTGADTAPCMWTVHGSAPGSGLTGALGAQASSMATAAATGSDAVDLQDAVCAQLRCHGLSNVVGEEGDAQEAMAAILSALQEEHCGRADDFKLRTQVIWRKPDGSTKVLQAEVANMLHVPIPMRHLTDHSTGSVPLEHCIAEALEPPQDSAERFTTVVTQSPRTLLLHIRRSESVSAALAAGHRLPADMPSSGPDIVCPDTLSIRDKQYRLRAIVAHQRLQAGTISAAGAQAQLLSGSKFTHPIASVVVSGGAQGGVTVSHVPQATLDQGHYVALVREADSNACVLYSDSTAQFFSHERDAMTSPLQGFLIIYEHALCN